MSVRKRVAVVAAAVMVSMGLTLAGTPAAMAAPPAAAGSLGIQSAGWQGPFGTKDDCLVVQTEFNRYYEITSPCHYVASSGFYFYYE